ncbi:hypothetical protein EYF80_038677 [Liparis tanakae]|uniref:Uncharacterized protein n=1 Tax=Liparis tanakae TaxID=230148 RepID=A0A4Z2GCW7_9TELE|nr:hypothetical protein EYF80_038677 [Liparis tanakae]
MDSGLAGWEPAGDGGTLRYLRLHSAALKLASRALFLRCSVSIRSWSSALEREPRSNDSPTEEPPPPLFTQSFASFDAHLHSSCTRVQPAVQSLKVWLRGGALPQHHCLHHTDLRQQEGDELLHRGTREEQATDLLLSVQFT